MPVNRSTLVLLAEDDTDDVELFQDALSDLPNPVTLQHCENGRVLMQYLHHSPDEAFPDIIFLDLNMPSKSGFDCISEIKATARFKHIPVVIFSTSSDPDIIRLLHQQGADRYMIKPDNYDDLKNLISQALSLLASGGLQHTAEKDFILQPQQQMYGDKYQHQRTGF